MEVELRSSWQDIQVELLKSLHGFEVTDVNEEIGSVDYVSEAGDEGRRLLRVMVDGLFNAGTVDIKPLRGHAREILSIRQVNRAHAVNA